MLFDQEKFSLVESIVTENGTIARFEKENGKVKGRMMIDLIEPPEDLGVDIPSGSYCFSASFDFYDSTIAMVFNPVTRTVGSGLWVTPQIENADPPEQEWVEFFIQTLVDNIGSDGSFGIPMYTFISDSADSTVVPTQAQEADRRK